MRSTANVGMHGLRKLPIYTIILSFLTFTLLINFLKVDQNSVTVSEELIHNPEGPNNSGHYNLLVVISSSMEEYGSRKLLRKYLFGINDNLDPCMRQETNVYYKFLIRPYKNVKYVNIIQNYTAEFAEYNDMVEFQNATDKSWQKTVLKWAQSLNKKRITYNYVVTLDVHSIINLEKIQRTLDSSIINEHFLTAEQKSNLVWGPFDVQNGENMFVVLGQRAIAPIVNQEEEEVSVITQAYYNYRNYAKASSLYFVNDNIGMMEWPNAVENIPIETTIAIGHIYQEEEVRSLVAYLNLPITKICHPRTSRREPSIAVVTSSYVYKNLCMLPAAFEIADNKRDYALRNGYAFVSRSSEFAQQHYKRRPIVWGKIDVVEKVLPHYDWIMWFDMDAIIANPTITIENLLRRFTNLAGGEEEFDNINLVIARPKRDLMINAGVFLMRNSDWSKRFLRDVQRQKDFFNGRFYEQRAMWDLIQKPEYRSGTLLLDKDDHTFNTFPHLYKRGDFVIHFAPEDCPAKPILDAFAKLKELEMNPAMEIHF